MALTTEQAEAILSKVTPGGAGRIASDRAREAAEALPTSNAIRQAFIARAGVVRDECTQAARDIQAMLTELDAS